MSTTLIGSTWIHGRSGALDDDNNREYTRAFLVSTSDPGVGVKAVLATTGVPSIGENFLGEPGTGEIDSGAVARRITPRQDSVAPNLWVVEVTYAVKPLTGGDPNAGNPDQQNPDPLLRPAQWQIDWYDYSRPVTHAIRLDDYGGEPADLDGESNPIVDIPRNSAEDPYDPPHERDDSDIVLTITRNEPWPFSMAVARLYKNAVNTDTFFGAPPGQCRMKPIRARQGFENNTQFAIVTYTIHIKEGFWEGDDWDLHALDQGYNELIAGETVAIADKHNVPAAAPVLLNGSGLRLDPPESDPFYRHYQIYPKLPFAPLGLE